jgi:hypothetical protein
MRRAEPCSIVGHGSDFASLPRLHATTRSFVGQVGAIFGLAHELGEFVRIAPVESRGPSGASPHQRSRPTKITLIRPLASAHHRSELQNRIPIASCTRRTQLLFDQFGS